MPRRIAVTALNASTMDILNTIRSNASYEYQSLVPEVDSEIDIPRVGDVLYGYPALANQFINALINRIALVKVKSAIFNNEYAELKKGYLEFGETVEEVFVGIAKAREFSAEKAEQRELKRTLPDVKSAFHAMNWKVQYPVTIQNEDLRMAFTSFTGVEDLIAKIVNALYTAAEYDEFLLFKYLIIKAVTKGQMFPVAFDSADMKNAAKVFRGMSNQLKFMSNKYNAAGVTTTTPIADQYIFMDSQFNAAYDVDVLASAFNMDKATFSGKLKLIDDFTTFDNTRFAEIMDNSNMIEPVTAAELAIMANVKGALIDREWFQVYDNLAQFTEKYVSSGIYWNYFYNVWKTISSSPFSNAIVFVDDDATITPPVQITFTVSDKSVSTDGTVINLKCNETDRVASNSYNFIQTKQATENFVGVHPYGSFVFPGTTETGYSIPQFILGNYLYKATSSIGANSNIGATFTFNQISGISDTLTNLSFQDNDGGDWSLSPVFSNGIHEYNFNATEGPATAMSITPTDNNATITTIYKVTGNNYWTAFNGVSGNLPNIPANDSGIVKVIVNGFSSGVMTENIFIINYSNIV